MANQHVIRRGSDWAVRRENATRDTALFNTQIEAFETARNIALNQGGDVLLHDRHGKIRERNTYGKTDYFPPPG